eukprot:2264384-Prymnesium_polylepis.1
MCTLSSVAPHDAATTVRIPAGSVLMKADVAALTVGSMPISSISGPMTIPPPMPSNPAATPARTQTAGYTLMPRSSHTTSPSTNA